MRREENSELPEDELARDANDVGRVPQEEIEEVSIEGEPPFAEGPLNDDGSFEEAVEFTSTETNPAVSESEEPADERLSESELGAAALTPLPSEANPSAADDATGEAPPPRRARWLDPHNPYIERPGPFMQLVLGRTTWQAPPPDAEEAASESSPAATAPPPPERSPPDRNYRPFDPAQFMSASASAAIAVSVQVSLTEEAIRCVAETSATENAAKTQQQVELLARKIFALEQQIFEREANRRALARHWRHY